MVNDATPERLRSLAGHRNGRPVLSAFLDLDPSTKPHPPARQAAIDSLLHDARHAVEDRGLDHEDLMALREVLASMERALSPSNLQNGVRGIAVFGPMDGGVEVLRLPAPVQNQVVLDAGPHIEPLVAFAQADRWCVALVDRSTARFFLGTEFDLEQTGEIDDDVHGQFRGGGDRANNLQDSIEEEVHHHLDRVAHALHTALEHRREWDCLVLGGQAPLRREMEKRLHPDVARRLVGWIDVDLSSAGVGQVQEATTALVHERRRGKEREALDRLQAGVGTGDGHGVHGTDAVLSALNEQRVEILLLGSGWHPSGTYDPTTGMLASGDGESVADGLPLAPVDDLAELAIARAYEQGAQVMVCDDPRLQTLGGIGAVTRF